MNECRCETCNYYEDDDDKAACNIREEWISSDVWNWIEVVGCASHSNFQSGVGSVFPSSEDLLLIAHDEWKRREERKHIHDNVSWVSGWISGFLTSKKFAYKQIDKLHKKEGC